LSAGKANHANAYENILRSLINLEIKAPNINNNR
jgi:hypothetical protein